MGTGVASTGKPAASGSTERFHWTLISHPPNIGEVGLSDPTAADPRFVPDVPGRYTLQLTYGDSRASASDTVTLDAVLPEPRVPIQTMATEDGFPGIKVGPRHPARASFSVGYPYWQVVVLDRSTLGLVSNKTYECPFPAPCESDQIASDLGHLNDTKLVIASLQPGSNHLVLTDLDEFKRIGAPSLNGQHIPRGYASLIGVPGLPQGQAQARLISDDHQASGDMVGYLTPDQYFNYTWLPTGRVPFDTRAEDTGATDNAIQVGGLVYKSVLHDATGGYHVVVLDGYTLALRAEAFFQTNQSSTSAATTADKQMTDFLKAKVRAGDLVFVNAMTQHGQPPLTVGPPRARKPGFSGSFGRRLQGPVQPLRDQSELQLLADRLGRRWRGERPGDELGQRPSSWGRALARRADPGSPVAVQAHHLERVRRTSRSAREPDPAAGDAWPLDGSAGAQKAIEYIGSHNNRLGADPRAAYWTQPFDQATWEQIASEVKDMPYPAGQGFTDADFKAAQSELVQEMTWVGHVRAYLKNLSSPFAENVISSWANLTTITDKVIDALKSPEQKAALLALDIFGGMLSIGGVAGGPVVETVAVAYEVALAYLVQDRAGGDQDTITGNAHELADHLVTLLQNAQAGFQSLGNILVGDYAALKTAGTLGGCSSTAPDCPRSGNFLSPASGRRPPRLTRASRPSSIKRS